MKQSKEDVCAICNSAPQDMLILSCHHNLCIDCATQIFALSRKGHIFVCQICLSQTPLDSQTADCLASLTNTHQAATPLKFPPKSSLKSSRKDHLVLEEPDCLDHHQKCIYYCFDCQTKDICSECILTQTHSNHNLLTLKKAAKFMKENILKNCHQFESIGLRLRSQCQDIAHKKQDFMKKCEKRRQSLRKSFDNIVKQIEVKYIQVDKSIEEEFRRSIQIYDGAIANVTEKYQQATSQIKRIKESINGSDQQIFHFFEFKLNQEAFQPNLPTIFPEDTWEIENFEEIQQQLKAVLSQINLKWQKEYYPQVMKKEVQNQQSELRYNQAIYKETMQVQNANENIGIYSSKKKQNLSKSYQPNLSVHENVNNINRLSDIKSENRKLELSRSINNATNIINKLQQRIKMV